MHLNHVVLFLKSADVLSDVKLNRVSSISTQTFVCYRIQSGLLHTQHTVPQDRSSLVGLMRRTNTFYLRNAARTLSVTGEIRGEWSVGGNS